MDTSHNRFADLDWQPRWNKAEVVAMLSQAGPEVMATSFFGVLRFRLDDDDSVRGIINWARQFADAVERAKADFEAGGKSFSEMLAEDRP